MKRLYKYLIWLNIDTALGAVITSSFIAKILQSNVPFIAYASLFIAILSIYNFDHLLDVSSNSVEYKSAKRMFYQTNFKSLARYQLLLLILLVLLVWNLPAAILKAGIVLGIVTVIYFLALFALFSKRFLIKEFVIASVFTLGLFLAPYHTTHLPQGYSSVIILWFEIFILAFSNTMIMSWYEYDQDKSENRVSYALSFGRKRTFQTIFFSLVLLLFAAMAYSLIYGFFIYQILLVVMGIILMLITLYSRYFGKNEVYRIFVETIFFLPIVYLL